MKTVYKYIKPYMGMITACLLIKMMAALTELSIPRILAVIIDEAVPNEDMRAVLINGGYMLMFALLTLIFNVIGNKITAVAEGKVAYDLRGALFDKTVNLDCHDTDSIGLSSLTSRLTTDTYNIINFLGRLMRVGVKGPLMLLGGIIITLTIDTRLALVLICTLPLVSLAVYGITAKTIPIYKEEQKVLDNLVRRVDETASGIRVIKALSKTEYEKKRFTETSENLSKKEIEAGNYMSATKPVTDLLLNIGFCVVILVGAILSQKYGFNAAGKLLAFMTYFTIILNNMIMMTRIFVQMSRSIASANRIEEVILKKSNLNVEDIEECDTENYIEFKHVSFSYNKKQNNLTDISFGIKKGETLGIIGATGSGKSTLVNLLLRLYDADEGEIFIDGRNIRSIEKEELYSMFGIVFQNDFIFQGSVDENISFFREGDMKNAITVAQADDFISKLKNGTESKLAVRGSNVSGGQKQRLLISRAVYSNPDILILDDSSSALDYKTDAKLRRAIAKKIDATSIIIAQRISSIKNADKILVIEDGKIIGQGTHEFLMENVDEYRSIAHVQMGGSNS